MRLKLGKTLRIEPFARRASGEKIFEHTSEVKAKKPQR